MNIKKPIFSNLFSCYMFIYLYETIENYSHLILPVNDLLSLEHTTWLIFFLAYSLLIFSVFLSSSMSFAFVLAHLNDAVNYTYRITVSHQMGCYNWNMTCKGYETNFWCPFKANTQLLLLKELLKCTITAGFLTENEVRGLSNTVVQTQFSDSKGTRFYLVKLIITSIRTFRVTSVSSLIATKAVSRKTLPRS